ncbi:exported hypothetical protein [Microcystis aeruginosa PCC 9807]|uniref:Uncharacterized protein n=1 Tax=Microcystis aeruginosa PCC 9807 TaxID=1160283 RepID=I4H328_MICAE|nr:exported hypothetical protein [Microcystis aeruginosa PCC 9807]
MKKLLTILTPLTLMGLVGVTPAQAAIVAGWNSFNADTASYPKAADNVGANITSTGLDTYGLFLLNFPNVGLLGWNTGKYLGKINYTYLTPLLPLASCLLPIFTRKLILHDYLALLIPANTWNLPYNLVRVFKSILLTCNSMRCRMKRG